MEFLRLIESARTPFLDKVFSAITMLGEETLFIVIGMVFFWCINKRRGYYILSIGLFGTIINQFLKLLFRIPRPWVQDESFTIVESARAEATGYSFPSGHTQIAVGEFGSIGRTDKHLAVKIICGLLCILIPFSRLYLGVHTPLDVGVSMAISLAMVFGLYPLMCGKGSSPQKIRVVLAVMTALSVAFVVFVNVFKFPADVDEYNLTHGVENAYKMLGCIAALWLAFEIDERYTKFDTKAVWWAQLLKLAIGFIPVLAIKMLLKNPLAAVFGDYVGGGVRYFLLTAVAGCVYPITFKWFAKLGKKKG